MAQFKKGNGKKKSNYTGKQYDNQKHLKVKKQTEAVSTNPRAIELQKKLNDAQEAANKAQMQPTMLLQEKYAHDLVVLSMMFSFIKNIADSQKDAKLLEAQKELENIKLADQNFQKNMENYKEFKMTYKELKIVETKTKDTKNSANDLKRLQLMAEELKKELEKQAKKFDFIDKESKLPLKFASLNEFLEFVEPTEKLNFSNDYRMDIADLKEVSTILNTPISELSALAEKTVDLDNEYNLATASTQIAEKGDIEKVTSTISDFSPIKQTLS